MLTVPSNLSEAAAARGEIRAGGTDVQERRRSRLSQGRLVDISGLPELAAVGRAADGATTIGALVTIQQIADDPGLRQHYPGLTQAAGALATPQIRRAGALGGALLQRTRCWYYRNPGIDCLKKGGKTCPARSGDHQFGVCFDLGPCAFPHPSTLGMVLMAYGAEVSVHGRGRMPVADLYGDGSDPHTDHRLREGEILTHVHLPPPLAGERAAYFRAISRARAEWPLVEAAARLQISDNTIILARVAVGGVANVPLLLPHLDKALTGQPATEAALRTAAQRAAWGAKPLPMTGYKVELLPATVFETLRRALSGMAGGEG